jgi:protein SCO1/2
MSQPRKILTICLWLVAGCGILGLVALKATRAQPKQDVVSPVAVEKVAETNEGTLPEISDVPDFSLIDQNGKPVKESQFAGHPWIADFIFTTCASLCPTMSAEMSQLQSRVPADVRLVSFSVDPDHDTPAVLKEYAAKYHADPGRWTFLTGDLKTQTRVVRGMKLGFSPAQGDTPIQHDEHFELVDGQGKIRGFYDSFVPQRIDALVQDARSLSAHPGGAAP